ncbi:MAG: transcription elongation factor GreB [Gammaproteobacteria bacterium]|nr:transcription elongation factor GreB [Gammaproteobacteria bacterium]
MGRYRPPQPKSSPYITRDGFEQLQAESKALWEKRAKVTEAVTAAAAEGDRSENAEYIYRKKQLREIDRRIRYLQKRIPDLTIVDRHGKEDQVFFGATVQLEEESGEELIVRIVGSDEIDPNKNYISVDSPLARAMIKKSVDDEATIEVLGKRTSYTIVSIQY